MFKTLGSIVISLLISFQIQAAQFQTQLEQSDWTELTSYERMMGYLEPLAGSSPKVKMELIGTSVSGRSIPALFFSQDSVSQASVKQSPSS